MALGRCVLLLLLNIAPADAFVLRLLLRLLLLELLQPLRGLQKTERAIRDRAGSSGPLFYKQNKKNNSEVYKNLPRSIT